ncbi:MAG: glycosyltransferase family 4 protein [Phycisphaerales bacterium]|nr:glycosyltransferase family 4 protein [Phycisphaerales bacterium]
MTRIMHISTRLILGGSQENTVLSCEGQVAAGHEVSLVYGPIFGPEGSLRDRVADHGGIELIETPHLVRELAPLRDARCRRDLRRLIRAWQPDVVHTHSSKAGILGRLAAWRERVPCVVHTIHGLAFHPYQATWRNGIYIAAERIAARRCHRIVCVADAMRDQALAAGIGSPDQYRTIYSGMEVDRLLHPSVGRADMRTKLGFAPGDFVVGTIARLAELKGHDDLLDALGEEMKRQPRLKLLWVGDGWWAPRLLRRVAEMGLSDQVCATGLVPPEEIPAHIQAMDVLAHPSYREGLPRALPQALISGVATIAYDVDGAREVCIDGETGRLVPPGDRDALAAAVRWMVGHDADRQAMGRRGREKCAEQFSAATMVEALGRLYDEVLGAAGEAAERGTG